MVLFLYISYFIVLLKQITEAIYKRFYFLVPLVYNYSIAPIIRRNFLYISLMFYSFISYIFPPYFTVLLKQLRGLYTSGFIFKYRQYLIIAPSVQTRIYAFSAPASCLRV